MKKTLNEHLNTEINNTIYEDLIKHNIKDKEYFFNSLYSALDYINSKKDDDYPRKIFRQIISVWDRANLSNELKALYSEKLIFLMASKEYVQWQLVKIQEFFKEYNSYLKPGGKKDMIKFMDNISNKLMEYQKQNEEWERKNEETKLSKIKTEYKKDIKNIKLFKFATDKKDNTKIIELMHERLEEGLFIKIDYKYFERHFFDNKDDFVKILWTGKKYELKAFVDLLIEETVIKYIRANIKFIIDHFRSDDFSIDKDSLRSVNNDKGYKEIRYSKPQDHPFLRMMAEIKNML